MTLNFLLTIVVTNGVPPSFYEKRMSKEKRRKEMLRPLSSFLYNGRQQFINSWLAY